MTLDRSHAVGALVMLLSAATYATKAIFIKLAYRHGVDAVTLLALRMLFAAPFFAVILCYALLRRTRAKAAPVSRKDHYIIISMGVIGFYFSSLSNFIGLQYITASLERIVLYAYPTIVVVASAILFRTAITRWHVLSLLLSYSGLIIAFLGELSFAQPGLVKGSVYVFICAVTFAIYYLGSGQVIPRVGTLFFSSYALLVSTVAVLMHFLATHGVRGLLQDRSVLLLSFLMAVISTVIPTLLASEGIRRIGPSTAAIVNTVGPVATIYMAATLLGEPVTALQLTGGALVIAGVLTASLKGSRAALRAAASPVAD